MQATISTRLVTAKDIKKGFQINNLNLNEVLNLSWTIEDHSYGQPLDYTLFTMKKGNKVIGGAVVVHLKATEDCHDPGNVLIEDLHYMLSDWTIAKEYRNHNKGYAEQLIRRILEVIKDPIGVLTDYKSDCDFYYLNGGNPLYSIEDLFEGASYFLFNVDVETGKKLSLQFASKRGDVTTYEIAIIDRLWEFNSKPHTTERLNGAVWDWDSDEEEETDDLVNDIQNVTLNDNSDMSFTCLQCEKRQCTYMVIQTRSADVKPKCVVTCLPCGFSWTHSK